LTVREIHINWSNFLVKLKQKNYKCSNLQFSHQLWQSQPQPSSSRLALTKKVVVVSQQLSALVVVVAHTAEVDSLLSTAVMAALKRVAAATAD
jgi:hypothetical protein